MDNFIPDGAPKKDLFSAHVFRDPVATTLFYKFISSLYKLSVSDEVKPTPTHQFISKLARRGKLVRCYTQNIDCLEDDVGLTQALDLHNSSAGSVSSNGSASKRFNGHCVQLHGRIDRVKCGCGYVGDWTGEVLEEMSEGYAPSCPGCDERGRLQHAKYPSFCLRVLQPTSEEASASDPSSKSGTWALSNLPSRFTTTRLQGTS
jgi:NAD-dependent SIR2 family protein deacetylase